MSDTQFDQVLRAVLRDMAPVEVPAALRAAVAAVPRTHPVPAGRPVAIGRPRLAVFAPIAAVIVLGIVGLVILLGGRFGGNIAAPSPTPPATLSPITSWTTLTFKVVASAGASASPGASPAPDAAFTAVAQTRLQSARVPFTARATAGGFSVTVPTDQSQQVEALVGTTGAMAFVPMGNEATEAGAAIDLTAHPPLFGSEGVQSAAAGTDQTGQSTLDMTLTPAAKALFATYTSAHIGEYLAIVLDGQVLTAPVIKSSIPNGQVQITNGAVGGMEASLQTQLIAILTSGPLPQPVMEASSVPASPPADPWTPGPIVVPTPSPSVTVVVPPVAVATELPALSGTPASVAAPFLGVSVSTLSAPTVNAPRVTAWAHGYLGFGAGSEGSATDAWSSADGRTWTPWPDGMLGLGSGGARLIGFAACRDSAIAFIAANGSDYAAVSSDGQTWTTTLIDASAGRAAASAPVAGGANGAMIAPLGERAVITTSDCSTWQKVPLDAPANTSIDGLAETSTGWVAVGIEGPASSAKAVAFWSSDGTTWNPAGVAGAGGLGFLQTPAVGSGGMLALVGKISTDVITNQTYYQSVDGKSWQSAGVGSLGTVNGIDGSLTPAVKYVGDGRQILAYGQPRGDPNAAFEYSLAYVSENATWWNGLPVDGPAAASVIGSDTGGQYQPVLLRDGILFVNAGGTALFGQGASH